MLLKKYGIYVAIGVVVLAVIVALMLRARPAVQTARLVRGPAVEAVYATGTVEPVQWAKIGPKLTGRITEILAKEGDKVARGAVLARLDDREARANVKQLLAREAEFRVAAKSIQQAGEPITHEKLLDIFIDAPNPERVNALVQLTRPALDYIFFQKLTERIEKADGTEKQRLTALRGQILEISREIDKLQEARAAEAAGLLKALIEADDLDHALMEALPMIDELFLSILQANIRASQERGDQASEKRLRDVDQRLRKIIRDSLPPGLQLAQKILELEEMEEIQATLENAVDQIDQDMLGALMSTIQRLESSGNMEGAQRIKEVYRKALRLSMKSKAKKSE